MAYTGIMALELDGDDFQHSQNRDFSQTIEVLSATTGIG